MGKKYYHRYPGACFLMPDGKDIKFAGGEFDTASIVDTAVRQVVERELDKIANVPASMIYTKEIVEDLSERGVKEETMSEAVAAFDSVNKIPAGTSTVRLQQVQDQKPVLGGGTAGSSGSKNPPAPAAQGQGAQLQAGSLTAKLEAARKAVAEAGKANQAVAKS